MSAQATYAKTYLVTGGCGFIGSHFIEFLLNQQASQVKQVINLDALTYAGSPLNVKSCEKDSRYSFVQADIRDAEAVEKNFQQYQPDVVVHFAAESHVDRSIHQPEAFVQTNVVGTLNLLEAARNIWKESDPTRHRFHHVSTDEVYGSLEANDPAFHEATPYAPNSPYAASKAASDHLVRAYHATYGLPVTISNCSNNYGPRQFPEKLIPLMILQALEGRPLPIYGDGLQVRDWLYVIDHCEGIWKVLEKGHPGQTYHFGGSNQPTNREIVEALCSLLDELVPDSPHRPHAKLITQVTDRPGHDRRYAMDIRKAQRELSWSPQHSLQKGLRATVAWYLKNQEWVEAIRRQPGYLEWMERQYSSKK